MFFHFKIVCPSSTDVTFLFLHFDIEHLHIHTFIHYVSGCAWKWKRVHSCRNGDNDVILVQPVEGDELPHLLLLTWNSLLLFVFFKYVLTPYMEETVITFFENKHTKNSKTSCIHFGSQLL